MGLFREYTCLRCKKTFDRNKVIRIQKQEYGAGKYNQFYKTAHYDFCLDCYKLFDNWIKKFEVKK